MRQLLVYKDTVLTEEQIKAHHNFLGWGYNNDIWKSSCKQWTCWWPNKRIFQENCSRWSFKMITFTSSSELTSETLWILFTCEKFNARCLKIKVVSKMHRKCFLKLRLNFMSCCKNQGCFQNAPEPPFFLLLAFLQLAT